MLSDQFASTSHARTATHDDGGGREGGDEEEIREIHALTPPPTNPHYHARRSSSMSTGSTEGASSENNFTSMSREFSALVLAGSSIEHNTTNTNTNTSMMMNMSHDNNMEGANSNNLGRIGEEDLMEDTNPLAIVPDSHPLDPVPSPRQHGGASNSNSSNDHQVCVQRVKKEEVDAKISAWQNAKVAKINNRFKREDAVINGWESEQVQKATSWMNKVERKLEEKRAKALEKMQNEVAKAHRKAEERRASAEAKRGTKVARVLEIAGLMRAVGRPPAKKSFF